MREGAPQVLIVDDDRDIGNVFERALEYEGYRALKAKDGREALDILRAGPLPKLILLDLMMPVMNGLEFRAQQRSDPALAAVPVVVVSSDPTFGGKLDATGFAGFLKKPVSLDDLVETVRRFCG